MFSACLSRCEKHALNIRCLFMLGQGKIINIIKSIQLKSH